ncbi:hypothetical protein GCM10009549_26560 [Streptomyces thermoalcalitolerans]|uniref:Uncharacterized protein n=1 Tax=Streptomyces thermoalcalitolerans TaxID=65605 RepID=A0ABN1NP62_9ACTN
MPMKDTDRATNKVNKVNKVTKSRQTGHGPEGVRDPCALPAPLIDEGGTDGAPADGGYDCIATPPRTMSP